MILFKPQASNKFTCIPREYVTDAVMTIRDDSTNVTVDYPLVPRIGGVGNIEIIRDDFNVYNSTYQNMVEGHFYDMTIFSDPLKTNVIYKDRIFCTAQKDLIVLDIDYHYELNKGQYDEYDGFNNDYIVV
jgi:hypothetical protein